MAECLPRSAPFQSARPRMQARRSLVVSAAEKPKGFSEGGANKAGGSSAKAKVCVCKRLPRRSWERWRTLECAGLSQRQHIGSSCSCLLPTEPAAAGFGLRF